MKYGYIYKTINLINGKIYIGQHKANKFNIKYMGSDTILKEAFEKYGKENFKVEMVNDSANNSDELNKLEIYYIQKYNTRDLKVGYNLHVGGNVQSGENNPMYGKHFKKTPEEIERIRQFRLGKSLTLEQRQKISNTRKQRIKSGDITVWNKGISTGSRTLESIEKGSHTIRERLKNEKEFIEKMTKMYKSRVG